LIPWWDRDQFTSQADLVSAYRVVENWRTSHSYPLNAFQVSLRSSRPW
jgi:hypothetical protein